MILSRVLPTHHAVPSHYLLPLPFLCLQPPLSLGRVLIELLHHVQHLMLQELVIKGEGVEMNLGKQVVVFQLLEGPPRTEETQNADAASEGGSLQVIQGGLEVFQGCG